MVVDLIRSETLPTAEIDPTDDRPAIGSWWWVKASKGSRKDTDRDGQWLGCVIAVGSNYAKLEGVHLETRIPLDLFHQRCAAEPDPDAFIQMKLGYHKAQVRQLMEKIRSVCALLGVPMSQALAAAESSTALAVAHGIEDVKKYKRSLVKAKDKTLPALFKEVTQQHEAMAMWMKADLIPARAELKAAKAVTEAIEGKIHMVELYAGLQELVQVRDGAPAPNDTKVHLMQRRAYMDEECLAQYEAGGMDFKSIAAFDQWLARDENFARLLPHDRCILAFQVRRHDKAYDDLSPFIRIAFAEANQKTFLYIRNGRQLWRMETSIAFDEELFPRKEDSDLLGEHEIWIKEDERAIDSEYFGGGVITARQRNARLDERRQERSAAAHMLWQWKRAGKPTGNWECVAGTNDRYGRAPGTRHEITGHPVERWCNHELYADPVADYVQLTPESIYHDDVMKRITKAATEQNRVAVIMQGLLDRSTCLHPHPPWRIWTPEGFAAGIELVYDVSRAITPGEAPNWEGYRAQLNKSIRVGATTIGQLQAWRDAMEDKYGRHYNDYGSRAGDGPKQLDIVQKLYRDGSAEFAFTRERLRPKWVPADRPGYRKQAYPEIPMLWRCPAEHLTCIDAYTPGDFHLFFDDPRTRANYLQWAPILLAAEDWHHARREGDQGETVLPKKKKGH